MAYQTGPVGTLQEFVNKLRLFAESVGWITDRESHGKWYFHNPAMTLYFGMEVSDGTFAQLGKSLPDLPAGTAIYIQGAKGFDGSKGLRGHPDSSVAPGDSFTHMALRGGFAGNETYYFFATLNYIHAVWASADDTFYHMHLGVLDKRGMVYDGGEYIQANGVYWPGNITTVTYPWDNAELQNWPRLRANGFDSFSTANGWRRTVTGLGRGRNAYHPDAALAGSSANAFTGDTVLIPNRILLEGSNQRQWYLGEVPDFAVVSMRHSNPRQILTYGAEEWQVFPANKISNIDVYMGQKSADVGYAYRVRR